MVIKVFLAIAWIEMVLTAPRNPRLSLAEYPSVPSYYYNNIDGNPNKYSFGYDVSDPLTGNSQHRSEERYANGTVIGSYGYIDPNGMPQRFRYIADQHGYRVYQVASTTQPYAMPHYGSAATESSVTWTRPPRPSKKKAINDLVSQLGTLFTKTNLL